MHRPGPAFSFSNRMTLAWLTIAGKPRARGACIFVISAPASSSRLKLSRPRRSATCDQVFFSWSGLCTACLPLLALLTTTWGSAFVAFAT